MNSVNIEKFRNLGLVVEFVTSGTNIAPTRRSMKKIVSMPLTNQY
jgi:hypothetical protein